MSTDPSKDQPGQSGSGGPSKLPIDKLVEVISRSQHNYRELIDNLDQAVFTLSLQGEILVANRRLSEILGLPFSEFIGRPFTDLLASPTLAEAREAFTNRMASGSWQGTIRVRLKRDKGVRHFSCWFQSIAQNGQLTAVIGWARDATPEHESELRFAELFESLREGMFFTTSDGRILDANPALIRMLGYSNKEELQAGNFRDLYADPSVREAIVRDLEAKGSVEDREIVLRHKSGKNIHCLASGFAIRDASGRIARLQGTLVDVTERIEIERRLRHEQEFVRRLIASFPDVIGVLDRQGRYTYVSQRVEDVLGNPPQEYIGEELGLRANPEDRPKLTEAFRRLLAGEVSQVQLEFRTRHRNGSWRILKASAGPLYEDGRINGIVASARDVTDSTRLEEQLAQNEKFAAMGQMLVGAAHELNNPLTAIMGVGDLMRERAADDSIRRHAEIVLQQARRAAEIVQNLLAFSRPPAQGSPKIRLTDLVRQILQDQREPLRAKNIDVHLTAPSSLPLVEADPKLLRQAFVNILTNAQQAISSVRDHGALEVSLSASAENVIATFSDDGPGIPAEDVQRIFDPFFTTKRPGGGSGLGLTISLAVIKEHRGTIEVQSERGSGATFRVLLPIATGQSAIPAVPVAEATRDGFPMFSDRSLLIVDDEESIREIVQEGLSARGLKVDCAENAEAALARLAAQAYEVVLCDFNLPGLRGTELFDRIRQHRPRSPITFVFMTGDMVEPAQEAKLRAEGAHILQKPFHVSALASLLSELLQPHSARK
jgi:PAS domain S-box-containing protein